MATEDDKPVSKRPSIESKIAEVMEHPIDLESGSPKEGVQDENLVFWDSPTDPVSKGSIPM